MRTAVVLFTRDLRVHDNPTLAAAADWADRIVPLFVLDQRILESDYFRPNRAAFLADSLDDLAGSLGERGAPLLVRHGQMPDEVVRVAREHEAEAVFISGDVSGLAQRRWRALREALGAHDVVLHTVRETNFVVPASVITPDSGDHMKVFTPYFRRWDERPVRELAVTPRKLHGVQVESTGAELIGQLRDAPRGGSRSGPYGEVDGATGGFRSPALAHGGEQAGRDLMHRWMREGIDGYADGHDDLAGDKTSRLSPYLHFGCVSPVELVHLAREHRGEGAEAFVRQIAWRDFHAQVLAARPDATRVDYRPRGDHWRRDEDEEFVAWRDGQTGFPIVDAGMRQLAEEGWMHNRARLIVAHFLTKTLYIDWRLGAQHFIDLLVDGDVANNTMNWQWVAGTGTDTRPNRTYNMTLQAQRHDPSGDYVRRYVPELRGIEGGAVHEPWKLPDDERAALAYPDRIVDPKVALDRFRRARGKEG
jgi:deoxyribodipyrimidine photo-lyase